MVRLCRGDAMTSITRRFGDQQRQRLAKLVRTLGSDNAHEADAARSMIDSLLREYGKGWDDLIELLGGDPAALNADLVRNIVALGACDPEQRATARRNIADLLARHRKSWNDLADVLCAFSHEPWACNPPEDDPERVSDLIGLIHYVLGEYVQLKEHEYVAVALWILHTHIYPRFPVTPRLALRSPTPGCGKSTLFDILSRLVNRPAKFDAITTSVMFRLLDETHPTLLIDEADNLGIALGVNGRLRAVFNSGHRAGGTVAIMEHGHVRKFSTFAPLALALPDALDGLPRTLAERCITIQMERSDGKRKLSRVDANRADPVLDQTYGQILMWRPEAELNPDPEMPIRCRNRDADNWRPLIAIADACGYGWGDRAREAMAIFSRESYDADIKIRLLSDIRRVLDARGVEFIWTQDLVEALHDLDGDWEMFCGIRGDQQPHRLKDYELAGMLRHFKIRPHTVWPRNRTSQSRSRKGYRRNQFEPVWRAYCDDGTASQASNIKTLRVAGDGTG
jgi:hypothetical protein